MAESFSVSTSCRFTGVWEESSSLVGILTVSNEEVEFSAFGTEVGNCGRVTVCTEVMGPGLLKRYCLKTLSIWAACWEIVS